MLVSSWVNTLRGEGCVLSDPGFPEDVLEKALGKRLLKGSL